jgi:urease accessory protein
VPTAFALDLTSAVASKAADRAGAAPRPGGGRLVVGLADGASSVLSCVAASPLHLFSPRPRGQAVWIISATLGGGLVAGDAIALEIDVHPGATALIGSQAHAKVFRSPGPWASQTLTARVAAGGTLAVLPEPASLFAGARYRQAQRFSLEPGASLLVLDAVTHGRAARGEAWALEAYHSRNEVEVGGRVVLADALRLVAGEGPPVPARLGGTALLATAILAGPALERGAAALRDELAHAPAGWVGGVLAAASPIAGVLAGASPPAGGVLLRLASTTVEAGLRFIRKRLAFAAELLGGDPLARRP